MCFCIMILNIYLIMQTVDCCMFGNQGDNIKRQDEIYVLTDVNRKLNSDKSAYLSTTNLSFTIPISVGEKL